MGDARAPRIGGDVVVEALRELGVTQVFGLPGQHALGLFDAFSRSGLQIAELRVENNVAFAADGYARATGRVGVVALSTGPGALTALAGLQEAWATSVPLLVLVSQVPTRGLGVRSGMLHQLDDQAASAANVTKSVATVRSVAEIAPTIRAAWARALAAPSGPVWVELPQDVLLEATSEVVMAPSPDPVHPARAPREIAEATRRLDTAVRPVILAGGGVRRSKGGCDALVQVAELLDAPVVETVGGRGSMPSEHPLLATTWIENRATTSFLEGSSPRWWCNGR